MIKLYICCLVLIIGNVEVGPDMDMKFHQVVMKIVSYDIHIEPNICSISEMPSVILPLITKNMKRTECATLIGDHKNFYRNIKWSLLYSVWSLRLPKEKITFSSKTLEVIIKYVLN